MTYDIETIGYKRQMTDIAAAMGIAGLGMYDFMIHCRRRLLETYKRLLKGIKIVDGEHNTYWLCTVLVDRRDDFAKMLFDGGVDTNLVQIRNDAYKVFGGKVELPVMDRVEGRYISLPLHMGMTVGDVEKICGLIKKGW